MPTFSPSRSSSSRSNTRAGFTLVELIVSATIISIISTVVIVNYLSFDSATLLNAEAFEIATTLREAQVFSLSVRAATSGDFDTAYGLSFDHLTIPDQYVFFRFPLPTPGAYPVYNGPSFDITRYYFDRTIFIQDVCVEVSGAERCNDAEVGRLDISFKRPEFEAFFHTEGTIADNTIEAGLIKLSSRGGTNVWVVRVGKFGDIYVYKQP